MRAKRFEAGTDELVKPCQRLLARHWPGAVRVAPPQVTRQISEHCLVDVVELEAGDIGPRPTVLRWLLAVVVVKVPLAAERLVTVHQHVVLGSLPPIEVFHLEALPRGLPSGEVVVVAEELVVSNRLDAVAFEHGFAIPAHWFHGDHPLDVEVVAVCCEARRQCWGGALVDLKPLGTQFGGEVAHRADH